MHPVEQAWMAYRRLPLMDAILKATPALREREEKRIGMKLPTEVVVPTHSVNMALVHEAEAMKLLARDPSGTLDATNRASWAVGSWVAYRESKRIFQFTPELARELDKLRQPMTFPIESLTIPARAVVLDFSAYLGPRHPAAYVLISYDTQGPHADGRRWNLTLNISALDVKTQNLTRMIHLPVSTDGQSIYGAYQAMMAQGRAELVEAITKLKEQGYPQSNMEFRRLELLAMWDKEVADYDKAINGGPAEMVASQPYLPLVINALFYLRGDKDVVREIHPGAPPEVARKGANLKKLGRRLDFQEPRVRVLGERFTQALKHYELEKEKLQDEAREKGTKAPHLRRPHLHTYRIGEGRTGITLRFLGWQGIAGAVVPPEMNEMFATITPVE